MAFRGKEASMEALRLRSAGGLIARACAKHMPRFIPFLTLVVLVVLAGFPAMADDVYKGKSIKLVVSDVPGGGYDAYSRLVAHHLVKYLPGQPNITVINMPGAEGMIGANYMFNIAERDGSVIAGLNRYTATDRTS